MRPGSGRRASGATTASNRPRIARTPTRRRARACAWRARRSALSGDVEKCRQMTTWRRPGRLASGARRPLRRACSRTGGASRARASHDGVAAGARRAGNGRATEVERVSRSDVAVGGDVRFLDVHLLHEFCTIHEIGVRTRRRRGEWRVTRRNVQQPTCYYNKCLQSCTACVAREEFFWERRASAVRLWTREQTNVRKRGASARRSRG